MKNKRLLVLSTAFALTLAIGVTSCKKSKDDNGASSQFSATLGTEAFKPALVVAMTQTGSISIHAYQAKAQDTSYLELYFPETATATTKIDLDGSNGRLYYWNFKNTYRYTTGNSLSHGTITFTTIDKTNKKVAGNFSGVLYQASNDSVVVKDGKFNTTYISF